MRGNQYNNLQTDIKSLIEKQDIELANKYDPDSTSKGNFLIDFAKILFDGFLIKSGIKKRLIYSSLSLEWFYKFRDYWTGELGGRPINPHDFYFLFGIYRQKFQAVGIDENIEGKDFLEAWQDSRNIYSIFSQTFKFALNPLRVFRFAKYISQNATVLEYGCGIAPLTQSLIKYYGHKRFKIHCADIPSFMFHWARWRLKDKNFVKFIKLDPDDLVPLKESHDIIFLIEVLEHLTNPLAIIKHIIEKLNKNGILVFDYIKSEGEGLDTQGSVEQRLEVLRFIKDNFEILEGDIYLDGRNIGTTIVRKNASL